MIKFVVVALSGSTTEVHVQVCDSWQLKKATRILSNKVDCSGEYMLPKGMNYSINGHVLDLNSTIDQIVSLYPAALRDDMLVIDVVYPAALRDDMLVIDVVYPAALRDDMLVIDVVYPDAKAEENQEKEDENQEKAEQEIIDLTLCSDSDQENEDEDDEEVNHPKSKKRKTPICVDLTQSSDDESSDDEPPPNKIPRYSVPLNGRK